MANPDLYIKPALPDCIFPWENYDPQTREEIDALFALMDGDMGLKCPHGRPVVVKMSRTEIEKMFKRIV